VIGNSDHFVIPTSRRAAAERVDVELAAERVYALDTGRFEQPPEHAPRVGCVLAVRLALGREEHAVRVAYGAPQRTRVQRA
jgi:hypothetical protein